MRLLRALFAALLIGGAVAAIGLVADDAWDGDAATALGPGVVTVDIDIEYSRFDREHITVNEGTLVRFVVHNRDPIAHELVVGPESVHRRHERGTESAHPPVPGEVSVGPSDTGLTMYTFDDPGQFEFACHLPGHVAYGMTGTVEVLDASP